MAKYTTIEELKRLSVQGFEDFLKHYWKTEEFTFVATFVSEKNETTKRSGRFKNFRKKRRKQIPKISTINFFRKLQCSSEQTIRRGGLFSTLSSNKVPFPQLSFLSSNKAEIHTENRKYK